MLKKPVMLLPCLTFAATDVMGRGVFTTEPLKKGTVLEIAPVIVMHAEDRKLLDQTLLHDYIFEWGAEKKNCCMALGYIPLYNHAVPSNCDYEMDYEQETISVVAVRDIKAGEQLFINYNGSWEEQGPVWFEAK